jgi:hypothetical protein
VLILNPWIIIVFASVKMDVTSKKRAKIVALNKHTLKTVRDIALLLVLENQVCQEFFVHTRIPDHLSKEKKKM